VVVTRIGGKSSINGMFIGKIISGAFSIASPIYGTCETHDFQGMSADRNG
jgi:hypothetical protein